MNKYFFVLALIFIYLGSLSAQNFVGKLNPFPNFSNSKNFVSQNSNIKILAVMVDFQEDKDQSTFGTGKFGSMYSQDYGNSILDPLPHDRDYFLNHLKFTENYYRKVSGGKLTIDYEILPDIISVSQTMRNYSPPPGSDELNPVGEFAREVWSLAYQQNSNFNFSEYDIFLIFHAGVGRDISVPGSLGLERDIPSVYLSPRALQNIFGDGFQGFEAGNFFITNSMIIPSTESRELIGFGGTTLLELSINGLLVASIGSHLGLPDLFDTETGLSAIGRFGLMDGQAIFTYSGLFPPEPSPWEKIFLGWIDPIVITVDTTLEISANIASLFNDLTYIKIPINSEEYYLIENRNRDALNDGITITYVLDNKISTINIPKDTTGFRSFAVDTIDGVVIDVDEFDWAIPGNGIVIWHIDEKIINEKISSNRINTDKFNRGVDVEEADGVQEIGEQFNTIFGDIVLGEGTEFDLWHRSNPATLYKNSFNSISFPNTNSNSGSESLISITDFSEISTKMNFKVTFSNDFIELKKNIKLNSEHVNTIFTAFKNFNPAYYYLVDDDLFALSINPKISSEVYTDYLLAENFSSYDPALVKIDEDVFLIGAYEKSLNIIKDFNTSSEIGIKIESNDNISLRPYAELVNNDNIKIIYFTNSEKVELIIDPYQSGENNIILNSISSSILKEGYSIIDYALSGTDFIHTYSSMNDFDSYIDFSFREDVTIPENILSIALVNNQNTYSAVVLTESKILIYHNNSEVVEVPLNNSSLPSGFSITDLKNDGNYYILITIDGILKAFNQSGAIADNFNIIPKDSDNYIGIPVSADLNNDNYSDMIVNSEKGNIFIFDGRTGKTIFNSPIAAGKSENNIQFTNESETYLTVVDENSNLISWNLKTNITEIDWTGKYSSLSNNKFYSLESSLDDEFEFFPSSRIYNWPNPVYGNETYIRCFVSENSEVEVKIFDISGAMVDELNFNAVGGMDNETKWNVTDIQSGVYFAHIEAKSTSGKSNNKIIKIAVIK